MQSIISLSIAPNARDWLVNSSRPRILHVFDHVCNLINERGDVLSIVTQQIGNGPFNLVIEDDVLFSDYLSLQSPISFSTTQLHLGDLITHTVNAKTWSPRPNWELLHSKREYILAQLTKLPIANYQIRNSLPSSLVSADIPSSLAATKKLAGLGIGLTPAGDDFIMGALYAGWIIHPLETASVLAEEIANTAAPLTTSLSAAWLRSAGKGEAGDLWHDFFDALIAGDDLQLPITKLLTVGETSGADALAGFFGVMSAFKDIIEECPS